MRAPSLPLLLAWPALTLAALEPSSDAVLRHGFSIFSAVHSAGKQWGSSVFPGSMSLIPAFLPAGTLLYHGGPEDGPLKEPEWLAFEPEHAENFAMRFVWQPQQQQQQQSQASQAQKVLVAERAEHAEERLDGYLSTYQAQQDIPLVFLDGSSAASPLNSSGTTDAQDLVLGKEDYDYGGGGDGLPMAPSPRKLCAVAASLGYRGIVRMEMGFEVIYCDFSDGGLKHISSVRELNKKDRASRNWKGHLSSWVRAAGSRYDGIGSHKLKLAYSSMVSFWLFDVDLGTERESRRNASLRHATEQQRRDIKEYALRELANEPKFTVDWGAITQDIVDAFAGRMRAIASGKLSFSEIVELVEGFTSKYYDATPSQSHDSVVGRGEVDWERLDDAMNRATDAFLAPATFRREEWTRQDELIYEAVRRTLGDFVIPRFFRLWSQLVGKNAQGDEEWQRRWARDASEDLRSDMHHLDWAEWKREQRCEDDELLFVPMFPFGEPKDASRPGCRSYSYIDGIGQGFWEI